MIDERISVAVSLARAVDRFRRRQRSESLESSPWTRGQLAALVRIAGGPPRTTSDLAALEYMRPQSMIKAVEALERGGLVTRRIDHADGRRKLISATERGHRLLDLHLAGVSGWLVRAADVALDEREHALLPELAVILDKLADADTSPVARRARRALRPGA